MIIPKIFFMSVSSEGFANCSLLKILKFFLEISASTPEKHSNFRRIQFDKKSLQFDCFFFEQLLLLF